MCSILFVELQINPSASVYDDLLVKTVLKLLKNWNDSTTKGNFNRFPGAGSMEMSIEYGNIKVFETNDLLSALQQF